MATPHAVLTHARPTPRSGRLRSGVLFGAAAALTFTLLPGTAAAAPASSPQQAAKLVTALLSRAAP